MLVYRDPECGCCEAWADIARKAGYQVVVENRADMAAVKARYDVPGRLASCHTAVIGGYAIEGHVPMRHVARLLQDKPRDVRGIAVPGMPRGSPGMELPDGSVDAFEVMAFSSDGKVSEFRACPAGATSGGRYNAIPSSQSVPALMLALAGCSAAPAQQRATARRSEERRLGTAGGRPGRYWRGA